eukprot:834988-Amphidinium_carterae.1
MDRFVMATRCIFDSACERFASLQHFWVWNTSVKEPNPKSAQLLMAQRCDTSMLVGSQGVALPVLSFHFLSCSVHCIRKSISKTYTPRMLRQSA